MEAHTLVHGDRRRSYGPVEKSFNNNSVHSDDARAAAVRIPVIRQPGILDNVDLHGHLSHSGILCPPPV